MLERAEGGGVAGGDGAPGPADGIIGWLKRHARAKFIEIDYPSLVQSPDGPIARIAEFLGPQRLPHPERMRSVIDDSLYRKRKAGQS